MLRENVSSSRVQSEPTSTPAKGRVSSLRHERRPEPPYDAGWCWTSPNGASPRFPIFERHPNQADQAAKLVPLTLLFSIESALSASSPRPSLHPRQHACENSGQLTPGATHVACQGFTFEWMLQILIQAGQDAVKKNRAICTHVVSQWTVGGIIACLLLLLLGCRLAAGGDVQGTAHGIQLASRSVPNFCHRPALHRQDKQQEDTQGIHNKLNKHSVRSVVKVAPTDRQACLIVLSPAASTSFTQKHGPRAPATCPALITHLAPLNELYPCRAHHICAGWYGRFVVHF